jgi:hypothetical protein
MFYLNRIQISHLKTKRSIIIVLVFLAVSVVSQTADSLRPKWKLSAIAIKMGGEINIIDDGSNFDQTVSFLDNCKHVAPNSKFNNRNFAPGFDTSHYNSFGNYTCNVFAEIKLDDAKRSFYLDLRAGLYFNNKRTESLTFREQDSIVVENLMDGSYNYTLSTNYCDHYQYEFTGQNLGIEITPLLNYKRWTSVTPFIGLSGAICYSYNNKLTVLYNPYFNFYDRGEWGIVPLNKNTIKEVNRLKDQASFYVGIPIGISFKHANKAKTFLLSPFFEARFGYKFEKYPSYRYAAIPFLSFQAGCKVNFRKRTK